MKTSDFDYPLPKELIAQTPIEPRDNSRLMILQRADGSLEHRRFFEIVDFLEPGDVVVLNDSRVITGAAMGSQEGWRKGGIPASSPPGGGPLGSTGQAIPEYQGGG